MNIENFNAELAYVVLIMVKQAVILSPWNFQLSLM
jgi:hypothetical protein